MILSAIVLSLAVMLPTPGQTDPMCQGVEPLYVDVLGYFACMPESYGHHPCFVDGEPVDYPVFFVAGAGCSWRNVWYVDEICVAVCEADVIWLDEVLFMSDFETGDLRRWSQAVGGE